MKIEIPEFALVLLVGASGSGKSTFAGRHFLATEIISSDACRAVVSDDESDQTATRDAFELVQFIADKRLARRKLALIDATNVQPAARAPFVALARRHHAPLVAIVLDMPEELSHERNRARPGRDFGPHVVRTHRRHLVASLPGLEAEGFSTVAILRSPEEAAAAAVVRRPLPSNREWDRGPFDIIGDVHGCFDELRELLDRLGYTITTRPGADGAHYDVTPPPGRKAVFVGDLVDRGPDNPGVLRLVIDMVEAGVALCVPGNHDARLLRHLRGHRVRIAHGLAETLEQLDHEPPAFHERIATFFSGLSSHLTLDGGALTVAHAGMKESLMGRDSKRVHHFALFGETTGEVDEFGLPIRYPWAQDYRGRAKVVYGHTPVPEPEWLNNTVCIDTGCCFGGHLTALRYPERTTVSVPARRIYYPSKRPFSPPGGAAALAHTPGVSRAVASPAAMLGTRVIDTGLLGRVTVREEDTRTALEVMSRLATDPRWLVYLPPATAAAGRDEHPTEAFDYYAAAGLTQVVCTPMHPGSRAVVAVARDEDAARARFDVTDGTLGACFTRTGRPFFTDATVERLFIERVKNALDAAEAWRVHRSAWFVLDIVLVPWSPEARAYVRDEQAARENMREERTAAYRHHSWPVASLSDLRVAPLYLMASERSVQVNRSNLWHHKHLTTLAAADADLFLTPEHRLVDLARTESRDEAIAWWNELGAGGNTGMIVRPRTFIATGLAGLLQPALKCRNPALRQVAGDPEAAARSLEHKRSLALQEFALGIEALERFVRDETLRRVHECVIGSLALANTPVDPRL